MDIFQILYLVTVLLAMVIFLLIGILMFRKWLESKHLQSLQLSLMCVFFCLAILFLIIEQAVLTAAYPNVTTITISDSEAQLARYLVCIAIFFSAIGLIFFNWFCLKFLPESYHKLIVVFGAVALIYAFLYYFLPYQWVLQEWIWEYAHEAEDWHEPLLLVFYLLPTWLPVIVLSYATYLIRDQPKFVSIRSLTLTIAAFFGAVGYTVQIISPSIISGAGLLLFPLLMYIGFTMPKWYQRILSVEE